MLNIPPKTAQRPLVLALDVGTSSARAVLYDALGRALSGIEGRTQYQMTARADGGIEIDADHLCEIIGETIDECLAQADQLLPDLPGAIGCVGYSNFWHAVLGLDAAGRAVTPLYNWSDTRSADDAQMLRRKPGIEWIHRRTGVVPHASYYPAKILWLRRTDPGLAGRIRHWVSIGEYFYLKLFGRLSCGVSMASGTGLFNPNLNSWDPEMLAELDLSVDDLAPLASEGEGLTGLKREWSERWPALARATWLPAAGDGACSNIGSGCFSRDRIAINVGTSGAMRVCWPAEQIRIPEGLWAYRANRRYALIGGALSNGGDVYAWSLKTLNLGNDEDQIEAELAGLTADGHGLTILPFFSGERSTGWHGAARASICGVSLSTSPIELLRAALESVTYRFAAIYDKLLDELDGDPRIIASGGGILNSRVWTQIMADCIGVPVIASAVQEASSRGAAMLALEAFGLIEDFSEIQTPEGEIFTPDPDNHRRYLSGRSRQKHYYDLLISNSH